MFVLQGVSGAPSDNNIMLWNAVIFGPHDTPFEDGTFKLTIEFTEEYPNKPPTVRLVVSWTMTHFLSKEATAFHIKKLCQMLSANPTVMLVDMK